MWKRKKQRKGIIRRYILLANVFFVTQVLTSCALLPKEEQFRSAPVLKNYEGTTYNKVKVQQGDVVDSVDVQCNYIESSKEDLSFSETDFVVGKVNVKVGQKVKADEILAVLKDDNMEQQEQDFKYQIKKLESSIKYEKEILALELEKQKKISSDQSALDSIQRQHNSAINSFNDSLTLKKMEYQNFLDQNEIYILRAGMDGVISYVKKNLKGSNSSEGETVISIRSNQKSRFKAKTEHAAKFKDGQQVTVTTPRGEYKTTVAHSKSNPDTEVFFVLNEDDGSLGQRNNSGQVKLIINQAQNVLYLPKSAVYTMDNKNVVYYEDENGLKAMKQVEIGFSANYNIEIKSGVSLGEEIITN